MYAFSRRAPLTHIEDSPVRFEPQRLLTRPLGLCIAVIALLAAQESSAQAAPKGKTTKKSVKAVKAPAAKPVTPMRFIIAPTGNEARYRVREQLVGVDLPNDAVGTTTQIAGSVLVYPDGRVVRDSSRIIVTITSLKSDKDRRDGFLQRRTLETDKFPTVELVPTAIRGNTGPFPATGTKTLELLGDLTVHGVMRPTVWQVTARMEGTSIVGSAATAFTFKDVGLDQPKVSVVLSVADTIKLEYDFRFLRDSVKP